MSNYQFIDIGQSKKKRKLQSASSEPKEKQTCPSPEPEASSSSHHQQESECPHCLQGPCVTDRHFTWLGNGQTPSSANSAVRKSMYSKFWKVLANLGVWNDPRYISRKKEVGGGGEWIVIHRREVMPVCVLKHTRDLYPNPQGQSYMGHKWE